MNQKISYLFYTAILFIGILTLSISCETGSPCDAIDCNNGVCAIDTMGNPICVCFSGYSGQNCEIDICGTANPCQNGGICSVTEDIVSCDCPDGYIGDNCENIDFCFDVTCLPNAFCEAGECLCLTGYDQVGDSCIALSAKFLGKYTYVDACKNILNLQDENKSQDSLEIVADPSDPTKFILKRFHQFNNNGIANNDEGTDVTGSVLDIKISNTMRFVIPLQSENTGDIYKSITEGVLTEIGNKKTIQIEYTAERINYSYKCNLTLESN